jgi:NADH-quinone oxidoreductase subunit J
METALFYLFGIIALIAAINVVAQRRVFYSAVSLIICLCAVAVLYMLLESPFIAAVQIVVYAGAIMVLFLFVIMLLDPYSAAALQDKKKSLGYFAILIGIILFAILYPHLKSYDPSFTPKSLSFGADSVGSVKRVGWTLFNEYLLPFEVTSVLILIAIIGVVVLAKRQRQS